jgi:hypothetical protein
MLGYVPHYEKPNVKLNKVHGTDSVQKKQKMEA